MNIVFDFGGVLFRWRPLEVLAKLLPEHASTPAGAAVWAAHFFQGYSGDWRDFDRGTVAPGPLAERIAARTGLATPEARRVIDGVPAELAPIAASVALLQRLHDRGHALYYLSNMPEPYARHLEAAHGFLGLFRQGVFSSRVQLVKPEPQIYAHAVAAFGIEPADTLFIDDFEHNIGAARAAGWQGLHFREPAQCERELVALGLL